MKEIDICYVMCVLEDIQRSLRTVSLILPVWAVRQGRSLTLWSDFLWGCHRGPRSLYPMLMRSCRNTACIVEAVMSGVLSR